MSRIMIDDDRATSYQNWPHKVRVSSELGTAHKKLIDYCTETFGRQGVRWDIEGYVWEYEVLFRDEANFMLFMLKWK